MSGQADPVGTPDDAIATIQELIAGAQNTQVIYVATKLGLADALDKGPRNADDIAAELGVNALTLRRLLRGLVNRGLVTVESAGTFSLTALGQCRKALAPDGRVLIIEDLLPGKVDGGMSLVEIDLLMLVCHNGRERTLDEYGDLLVREGLRLESVGETGGSYKLIVASAAPAE